MKPLAVVAYVSFLALLTSGCASRTTGRSVTNPRQPGPAVGQAIGTGVGAVAGNVAGAAVGVVEGAATAAQKPFDNTTRVVRVWRNETTSDGRVIRVAYDQEVDAQGRPIGQPVPARD